MRMTSHEKRLKKEDIWVSYDSAMPKPMLDINSQLLTLWFKVEQK